MDVLFNIELYLMRTDYEMKVFKYLIHYLILQTITCLTCVINPLRDELV